jgi:peptidoglycan/LPS O-acetylase OafA/YrhL
LLLILRSSSPAFVGLSFVYLANVSELFGVATGYGPLWSLAVEEHFYIVWPAFVRNLTKERLAVLSFAIVVGTPILRAIGFIRGYGGLDWYTWFVADGLAAGSLLAIVLRSTVTRIQVQRLCAGLLLGGFVIGAIGRPFGITTRARLLGAALEYSAVNLIFAGVLLLFLLLGASSRKRYINSRVLRFFGYISYGLYLDHILAFRIYTQVCRRYWPMLIPTAGRFDLVVLKFVVAGGGAIASAYVSRRYFEERFLRLKNRTEGMRRAEETGSMTATALPAAS